MRRFNRRGANAVEFALTIPLFLGITFASIEYGWYFASQSIVDAAVVEGCRQGSMVSPDPDPQAPKDVAEATIVGFLDSVPGVECTPGDNCTITLTNINEPPASSLQCEVTLDYATLTNWWEMPARLPGFTVIRYEDQVSGVAD